jgi:hypothetical protein
LRVPKLFAIGSGEDLRFRAPEIFLDLLRRSGEIAVAVFLQQ